MAPGTGQGNDVRDNGTIDPVRGDTARATAPDIAPSMMAGARIDWIEIPVTDMGRAAGFYGRIFETALEVVEKLPGIRSAFLPMPDTARSVPVAVLIEGEAFVPAGYQGCRLYFQAEPTMEAFLARVEEAGGAIEMPPMPIGPATDQTVLALFFDTEGNLLGAHGTV